MEFAITEMQWIRLTYPGALHNAMNRGHGGEIIFYGQDLKEVFLDILTETSPNKHRVE
jgi:hypothetical protein